MEAGTPKKSNRDFARLRGQVRRTVQVLSAILSVAEGLDRSHAEVVSGVEVAVSPGQVTLTLQAVGDAELEAWATARHLGALEKVLERTVRIETPAPVAAPAA